MRTRLWDRDLNVLYDSDTDSRTVEEFMRSGMLDEAYFTEDYGDTWKTRWSGKLIRTDDVIRQYSNYELLNYMLVDDNPLLEAE